MLITVEHFTVIGKCVCANLWKNRGKHTATGISFVLHTALNCKISVWLKLLVLAECFLNVFA